jgi:hypothetical protein
MGTGVSYGLMLLRAMLVVGVLALVSAGWGVQKIYVAIRESHQVTLSCADYVTKRPDARWLKLTDCEYDFDHLAYMANSSGGKYTAVYFPLRPAGEEGGATHIVVKRDDAAMLDVVYAFEHGNENPPGRDPVLATLMKPVEGLVQYGLDLDDKDKRELEKLDLGLANDFVLIDNDSKPNIRLGIFLLVLGLVTLSGLAVFAVTTRRDSKRPPPPSFMPPMGNGPLAGFERRI